MLSFFKRKTKTLFEKKERTRDIAPDEIFLDSSNLPAFDTDQFEGRLERVVSPWSFSLLAMAILLVGSIFLIRLWNLQVVEGASYFTVSENNRLNHEVIFARRGLIIDRTGTPLAWNESPAVLSTTTKATSSPENIFALRKYYEEPGLAHVLGYVRYPQKDNNGFYFQEETTGETGLEAYYDELLAGENGRRLTETNALGEELSRTVVHLPEDGMPLNISIDARIQSEMYKRMEALAADVGFQGGAGVILDVTTGEIIALTSFPEFDSQIMTDGEDTDFIESFISRTDKPFLNRATGGLYTPGSIIKPYVAAGALSEGVISSEKEIYSDGALEVPNPYNPGHPTVFKDWKAHGFVDVRRALAVSSNIYFYEVGGGFEDQKGLGISGIEKYARIFGIAEKTGVDLEGEVEGVIPNIAWKAEYFPGDPWRIGDTYHSAIGQYGFQVTPIQMARAVAGVASGFLVRPHFQLDERPSPFKKIDIDQAKLQIVREGMRQGVLDGTAKGLNVSFVDVAAKTGTAELGVTKKKVNSWVTGFFPYENPRYAFAVVMEQGPVTNLIGSLFVMRQVLEWMYSNTPEYFE